MIETPGPPKPTNDHHHSPNGASAPLVSVVMINYNGSRFIDPCLSSLLKNEYSPFEVIVVDNASTDDSVARLRQYEDRISIILNPRNELSSIGLNRGIRNAHGEIIVLLDMDTEVGADWLRELVRPMLEDPTIGVTGSKLYYPDGVTLQHAGGTWVLNAMAHHFGLGCRDTGQHEHLQEVDYVTGAAIAIRRDLFSKTGGGLDELFKFYYEDTDICWHARRYGYRVVYVPRSIAIHHESATMIRDSPWYLFQFHRSRCRFILKNYPWKSLLFDMPRHEIRWLLQAGHTNGLCWILPGCYLFALIAIPGIIRRRLHRRRMLRAK